MKYTTYNSSRFKRQQKQHVSSRAKAIICLYTTYTVGIRSTIVLLLFDVMMWFPHSFPLTSWRTLKHLYPYFYHDSSNYDLILFQDSLIFLPISSLLLLINLYSRYTIANFFTLYIHTYIYLFKFYLLYIYKSVSVLIISLNSRRLNKMC